MPRIEINLYLISGEDNRDLTKFYAKMGKPETNQFIMWWDYNSHHAGERSEITLAALSIGCREKKYKQGLLPFMIFYVAELFVAGKYCSCQGETPREMKS